MSEQGFRLSPQQRRLWQRGGGGASFRARGVVAVSGSVDPEVLDRAVERLIERHEILRTTYSRPSGVSVPLQVVRESLGPARSDNGQAPELDLESGPVLGVALARADAGANGTVLRLELPALSADTRTVANLLGELARAYAGETENTDALQYADVAEWANELEETDDERARGGQAFWQERLPTGPASEALPFLARPSDDGSFAPTTRETTLDREVADGLRNATRERGSSMESLLLTCWWIALRRLGGSQDAPIGVVLDGRTEPDLEPALGLFARVAPLPGVLPADVSFEEAEAGVRGLLAEAREWQDAAPQDFRPSVLFELTPAGREQASGEVTFTLVEVDAVTEPFVLKLRVTESGDELRLALSYDTRSVSTEEAERLAAHLETLVRSALESPQTQVGDLDLQGEGELAQLVGTTVDWGPSRTIHALFEEAAQRTPDADAAVCGGERLSYRELDRRADALAARLVEAGVGRGDVVGLCVERSIGMVVGLLGVLKASAAYLPLSPEHPGLRLAQQLDVTRARVVVTQPGLLPELPDFDGERLELRDDQAGETEGGDAAQRLPGDPNGTAYVISTSGSTGVPKAVAVSHTSLVNYASFICERLRAHEEPLTFATVSPLGVDLGYTSLFPSLVSGGCLHVIPTEVSTDGADFARYLADNEVDVLKIVPSHLQALLDGGEVAPRRFLILGGEAFPRALARRLRELVGDGCRLVNHYGPTETTVGSLTFGLDDDQTFDADGDGTVPIGRPIANTRISIVDERGRPVPVGVPGELEIGGAGVARGYVGLPEQTAERFLEDPSAGEAGDRVYRTGDLARILPDGNVEFLGRRDDQVKIRGYRVELGEIEAALDRHPDVRTSVVVVREETPGDKRVVAWFVPAGGAKPSASELRAHLRLTLPEHMLPASFTPLDVLPQTSSGKVDRRALEAREPVAQQTASDVHVAPRTPLEARMAELWEDVIGVNPVGATDDFFELGGHSLLALRLFSEIEKRFGRRLPLTSLFEGATVADLAQLLAVDEQEGEKRAAPNVVALQPKGSKRPFFCVHEFYGDVFVYRQLAAELGNEQPFYGLRARGLEEGEQPFTSVEEMAEDYVEQIRTIQPEGPYAVGGLSGGGIIAYEMAQQLRARGEAVDLVALLDTRGRNIPSLMVEHRPRHLLRAVPEWLRGALDLTRAQWIDLIRVKLTQGRARVKERRRSAPGVPVVVDDVANLLELSDEHRAVGAAQWKALADYVPKGYPGRVTLFRARMQPLFGFETFDRGWRAVTNGRVEIANIPGNHVGMLEKPHVRTLASELRGRLDGAPPS